MTINSVGNKPADLNASASDISPASTQAHAGYDLAGVGVTLTTAHGPLEILRDINLQVPQGQIVGIVGRSGTGKTTLLRVLGGLLRPTTGHASVDGVEIVAPPQQVVTVFQDYASALLPWRSLERNVALPLERSMGKAARAERVAEALAMVGLASRAKDYPWRLRKTRRICRTGSPTSNDSRHGGGCLRRS